MSIQVSPRVFLPVSCDNGEVKVCVCGETVSFPIPIVKQEFDTQFYRYLNPEIVIGISNDKYVLVLRRNGTMSVYDKDDYVILNTSYDTLPTLFNKTFVAGSCLRDNTDVYDNVYISYQNINDKTIGIIHCESWDYTFSFVMSDEPEFISYLAEERCTYTTPLYSVVFNKEVQEYQLFIIAEGKVFNISNLETNHFEKTITM